jgi:hypothetical protein
MKGSRFSEEANYRNPARAGGWGKDAGGVSAPRDLGRDLLHLWTAPRGKRDLVLV